MKNTDRQIVKYEFDGITAIYTVMNGVTSFTCVPTEMAGEVKESKLFKSYNTEHPYCEIEPMVQVSRLGDVSRRDFTVAATMYNRTTAFAFREYDRIFEETQTERRIVTHLKTDDGLYARHFVKQVKGYNAIETYIEIENRGEDCVLESAASFALSSLTPFCEENDPEALIMHRLHGNWSGEGRKESTPVSVYNFEDSWSSLGVRMQRIGALGSMPARGYIPFIAIEDTAHGATWAVQLDAPSSWQIEALHRYGAITLTGGQADFLYGHWRKSLKRGEVFKTHSAFISAVKGDLTKACAALTDYHETRYRFPESEKSLPVIYNEYLYSWGNPTMENVRPQLKLAADLGAEYFVLDAGWFSKMCDGVLGDWNVVKEKFPNGLKEFAEEGKANGFKACGVWYEFEGVTDNADIAEKKDWLLHENGAVINHSGRMFLDFRKAEVNDYLTEKVIKALNDNGLKYIKIDYNENIGFGADGAESFGEGLRQHTEKVIEFYKKLRDGVPGLVMEVCSSGGMRHEPLFSTLGSMVSFSDAHENSDGAVLAMDLHRIMQPRTLQVWASVCPCHDTDEVYFTMVKAMLGRICLSGKLAEVSEEVYGIVKKGVEFYSELKDVIRDGETVLIDTDEIKSLRHPKGVIRLARKGKFTDKIICYAMAYGDEDRIAEFPASGYDDFICYGNAAVELKNGKLTVKLGGKRLSAAVAVLKRSKV